MPAIRRGFPLSRDGLMAAGACPSVKTLRRVPFNRAGAAVYCVEAKGMAKKKEQKAKANEVDYKSDFTVNRILRRGQHGKDVRELQLALIARGYACGRAGAGSPQAGGG